MKLHLLKYKKAAGFSLTEILVVIFIMVILMSISLTAFSHSRNPAPLILASNQVRGLLQQTRAEAVAQSDMVALVVNDDMGSDQYQRSLNIANFTESAPYSLTPADPAKDFLFFQKKWIELPPHIVIEFSYSSDTEPNAFSSTQQGGATLAFEKDAMSMGSAQLRHPAVKGLLFDKYGAITAQNEDSTMVQYVNEAITEQKGCYLILRNTQKRPSPYTGGNDLSHLTKIYISPLTGKVTTL